MNELSDKSTLASELRTIAEEVASTVGVEMLERRAAGFSWDTKSTSTDVVTELSLIHI